MTSHQQSSKLSTTKFSLFWALLFRTLADDLRQEINGAHTTYICALYDVRTDTASTSHTTTMRFKSRRSVTNLLTILISPQINTTYLTANFFMCVCVCCDVMWGCAWGENFAAKCLACRHGYSFTAVVYGLVACSTLHYAQNGVYVNTNCAWHSTYVGFDN